MPSRNIRLPLCTPFTRPDKTMARTRLETLSVHLAALRPFSSIFPHSTRLHLLRPASRVGGIRSRTRSWRQRHRRSGCRRTGRSHVRNDWSRQRDSAKRPSAISDGRRYTSQYSGGHWARSRHDGLCDAHKEWTQRYVVYFRGNHEYAQQEMGWWFYPNRP